MKKLPDMARRLGQSLYRTVASAAEYSDLSTLKYRLQVIAMGFGVRAPYKRSRSDYRPDAPDAGAIGQSFSNEKHRGEKYVYSY